MKTIKYFIAILFFVSFSLNSFSQKRGHFIDYDADGNVNMDTSKIPSSQQLPTTMWMDAQAPHYVKNSSDTITIHLIRVEMKQ